jgi:hypothetical protein
MDINTLTCADFYITIIPFRYAGLYTATILVRYVNECMAIYLPGTVASLQPKY